MKYIEEVEIYFLIILFMKEQINYFPNNKSEIEQTKDKLCKKLIIYTIIVDILWILGIWIIIWLFYILYLISYKKKLNPKCYKKILIIWCSPLILSLLLFWWCITFYLYHF